MVSYIPSVTTSNRNSSSSCPSVVPYHIAIRTYVYVCPYPYTLYVISVTLITYHIYHVHTRNSCHFYISSFLHIISMFIIIILIIFVPHFVYHFMLYFISPFVYHFMPHFIYRFMSLSPFLSMPCST